MCSDSVLSNVSTMGDCADSAPAVAPEPLAQQNEPLISAGRLQFEFGSSVYDMWMRHLTVCQVDDGHVVFGVPTDSMAQFIQSYYADRLLRLLQDDMPKAQQVTVVAMPVSTHSQNTGGYAPVVAQSAVLQPDDSGANTHANEQPPLFASLPVDSRLEFANYVSGTCNQMAFGASQSLVSAPNALYSPLYIYGGVGMGKTHLLHAIAGGIQQVNPQKQVMLLSAEKFTYEFVRAVRAKNGTAFKEAFANIDVLLVDDIQFIAGKTETQQEFMTIISDLIARGKQVVVCADKSPFDLRGLGDREQSRLGAGLVVDIKSADYALRRDILQHKAEQAGATIPDDVTDYLAEHITSSIRELEASLNRLVAYANLTKGDITLELVEDCLADLLRNSHRKVTLEDIQLACTKHFDISMVDLHSARRNRHIARPRQIAMYLAKTLTSYSLPTIGRAFGGRDHTTVMHAVKTVEGLCEIDTALESDVRIIRQSLQG